MTQDTLFILEPLNTAPEGGGSATYCRDCIEIDGLLAMFPALAARLRIVRVPWGKPRAALVKALGENNQNCPALAFAEGGFANTQDALLAALHERHGFPIRST